MHCDSRAWKPLLVGRDAEMAERILRHFAAELSSQMDALCRGAVEPHLAGGTAGVAIAAAYIRQWQPSLIGEETIGRLLIDAVEAGLGKEAGSSLYLGLLGIGWAAEHVSRLSLSSNHSELCGQLDALVFDGLSNVADWRYRHDLFRGLVGLAVYLLERPRTTGNVKSLKLAARALAASAARLEQGSLCWLTHPQQVPNPHRLDDRRPYSNLGVPHGVPGVIAILSRLALHTPEAMATCEGGVNWLLAQRASDVFPCFSMVAGQPALAASPFVAWCYGDLGIASTLASAALKLGRDDWLADATRVGRQAAQRQPLKGDISLCHGCAGNGHLFARLYQFTGDALFADVSLGWYRSLMLTWNPAGKGFAGFRSSNRRSKTSAGFLRGASGAVLSLLAALSADPPNWDRVLLVGDD